MQQFEIARLQILQLFAFQPESAFISTARAYGWAHRIYPAGFAFHLEVQFSEQFSIKEPLVSQVRKEFYEKGLTGQVNFNAMESKFFHPDSNGEELAQILRMIYLECYSTSPQDNLSDDWKKFIESSRLGSTSSNITRQFDKGELDV